jgi:hypothetical protein
MVYLVRGGLKDPIALFVDRRDAEDYCFMLGEHGCEGVIEQLTPEQSQYELSTWEGV